MTATICPSEGYSHHDPCRALWLGKIEQMLADLSLGASRTRNNRVPGDIRHDFRPTGTRLLEIRRAYHWFTHGEDFNGTCEDAGISPDKVFASAKGFVRIVEEHIGRKYETLLQSEHRKKNNTGESQRRIELRAKNKAERELKEYMA